MTTILRHLRHDPGAIEPSEQDLRVAVRRALDRAGCGTFDDLAAQAASGDFISTQARMAWLAIEGLREYS